MHLRGFIASLSESLPVPEPDQFDESVSA